MRLLPDPELGDLLQMQRILKPDAYVDLVWTLRAQANPVIRAPKPWGFQVYTPVSKAFELKRAVVSNVRKLRPKT